MGFFGNLFKGGSEKAPQHPKPSKPAPEGEAMGEVVGFFSVPSAAIIKIGKGTLKAGATIWIHGHTTDLKQKIDSIQMDRKPIVEGKKGQEVGVKVFARVRRNDKVYKISP